LRAITRLPFVPGCAALALTLLAGCAQNAEAVFRHQHLVSIALTQTILDAEAGGLETTQRLYLAEEQLNEACAPLQEAGYRQMHNEEIDGSLQFAILTSLDGCRARAVRVEHLIRRVDPDIAHYFLGELESSPKAKSSYPRVSEAVFAHGR
jgi:hypothetical protein